jgi:hypothetical protein
MATTDQNDLIPFKTVGVKAHIGVLLFWTTYMAVLFALVVLWLTYGCATLRPDTKPPPPSGCEKSVIYSRFACPMDQNSSSKLVEYSHLTLRSFQGAKRHVHGLLLRILAILNDDQATYLDVAQLVIQNIKWINTYYGYRLVSYSEILFRFDQPKSLDVCDRELIKSQINEQLHEFIDVDPTDTEIV